MCYFSKMFQNCSISNALIIPSLPPLSLVCFPVLFLFCPSCPLTLRSKSRILAQEGGISVLILLTQTLEFSLQHPKNITHPLKGYQGLKSLLTKWQKADALPRILRYEECTENKCLRPSRNFQRFSFNL